MGSRVFMTTALLLATILAGCTDSQSADTAPAAVSGCIGESCGNIDLKGSVGAISGLVIDDRYRPLVEAEVLLLPLGLTTVSNENGEFGFVNLEPGIYTVRVQKDKHEAAPVRVDVVAQQFSEAIVEARRTVSDTSFMIAQEFSVFIPCNIMFIVNGIVYDCGTDLSGENFRAYFISDYSTLGDQVTFLLTEMKANQPNNYNVQVRGNAPYAALTSFEEVDYMRILNQYGVKNEEANYFDRNQPWLNEGSFQTIMFVMEKFAGEVHDLGQNNGLGNVLITGVGASFGIKAQFVQTLFIGEPRIDVETYSVLA